MNLEKAYKIVAEVDALEATVVPTNIRYKRYNKDYKPKERDIWFKFDQLPKILRDSINDDARHPIISIPEAVEFWEASLKERERAQDFIAKTTMSSERLRLEAEYQKNRKELTEKEKRAKKDRERKEERWRQSTERWYESRRITHLQSNLSPDAKVVNLRPHEARLLKQLGVVKDVTIKPVTYEPGWREINKGKLADKMDKEPPNKLQFVPPSRKN